MSHLGQPMCAAVEAAPIRREWEEVVTMSPVDSFRALLRSNRVRYLPSWNWNSGPGFDGRRERYSCSAVIGHRGEAFAAMVMVTPLRKGSVLDALMYILAVSCDRWMSSRSKTEVGSYLVL